MTRKPIRALALLSGLGIIAAAIGLAQVPLPSQEAPVPRTLTGHAAPTRTLVACPPLTGDNPRTLGLARTLSGQPATGRLRGAQIVDLEAGEDAIARGSMPSAAGAIVEADPVGGQPAQALGVVAARGGGDHFGLATALCRPPQAVTWFAGGAATNGHTVALELVNPSAKAVTVTIEAWGGAGPAAWARSSVLVAAGSATTVPLSQRMAGEARTAWRVSATGPGIAAFALAWGITGMSPTGYDALAATQPGEDLTIPLGADPADASVRLVNTTDSDATYTIDLVSAAGSTPLAGARRQILAGGSVADVSLAGVGKTTLAVRIRSTRPLVAGARLAGAATTVASRAQNLGEALGVDTDVEARDAAWASPVDALRAGTLIVAPGTTGRAVIATSAATTVRLRGPDGTTQTRRLGAHAASALTLKEGVYRLEATTAVTVGVSLSAGEGLSWLPLAPAPTNAVAATVDLRP